MDRMTQNQLLSKCGDRVQRGLTAIPGANSLAADLYELKRLNIHNQGTFRGFVRMLSAFGRFLRMVKRDVMRPFRRAGG